MNEFLLMDVNSTHHSFLSVLPSVIKRRPKWIGVILALIYMAIYFSWIQTISYNYYVSLKKVHSKIFKYLILSSDNNQN